MLIADQVTPHILFHVPQAAYDPIINYSARSNPILDRFEATSERHAGTFLTLAILPRRAAIFKVSYLGILMRPLMAAAENRIGQCMIGTEKNLGTVSFPTESAALL